MHRGSLQLIIGHRPPWGSQHTSQGDVYEPPRLPEPVQVGRHPAHARRIQQLSRAPCHASSCRTIAKACPRAVTLAAAKL